MAHVNEHQAGTPVWVDQSVETSEQREGLADFYTALFGWTWDVGSEDMGYYSIASHDGRAVMGLGQGQGGNGGFTTYFATEDIERSAARATELGASIDLGPMRVFDVGSMAILADPVGARHGLWQAGTFSGFGVAYEPGAPGWFDHASSDPARAAAYYTALTGHDLVDSDNDEMRVLQAGERWFASVSQDETPGRSAQWNPVYVVASLPALRDRVRELGATVVLEETAVPGSAISVFVEPIMGAALTVMRHGGSESDGQSSE